jgi:hypothetical protein
MLKLMIERALVLAEKDSLIDALIKENLKIDK